MATQDLIDQACGALKGFLERALIDELAHDYPLEITMVTMKGDKHLKITLTDA